MIVRTKIKKSLFKKVLSVLLAICMVIGWTIPSMPVIAFAAAPTSYTTITADSTASVSITSAGTSKYFKFVPAYSGTYKFYSDNNSGNSSDTYGYLLDANGSSLISNDDGGSGSNFLFTYACTAGATYYIQARMYSDSTGSYTLHVETVSIDCEHSYVLQSTTTADCENDGVETYVCSFCGNSYTNTVATALGHSYVNGTCARCGDVDYSTLTVVNINTAGGTNYSLFNSGRTGIGANQTGTLYSDALNPSPATYTNNGYDIYVRANTNNSSCSSTSQVGLSFVVDIDVDEKSQLTIYAYDVDEESGEVDVIYLVNETTGVETRLGALSGMNEQWYNTSFEIPANLLSCGNTYHIKVEGEYDTWCVYIRTANLIVNGSYEPTPVPDTGIENADLSASISSSGLVSVDLVANAYTEESYTLEYKAVSSSNNAQYGGKEYSVTIPTSSEIFSTTFQLESGARRGTYEITVFIKDGSENVIATRTVVASYGYSAVSYNSNGGSQNLPTDGITYSSGDTVTVKFDYVPSMYGYTFLGWSTDRNATEPMYTENGVKTFTIGSSDVTLYAVWALAVCEHEWTETSRTDATCTEDGLIVNTCSICSEIEEVIIPKLGHDYVSGVCSRCGAEEPSADVWDGSIDTSWYNSTDTEFTIYTAEQLAGLAQLVNNGNAFSGKTIYLGNNIDLAGREWTPIGKGVVTGDEYTTEYTFRGVFDGNCRIISNLYIHAATTSFSGLFGMAYNSTIKNLGIENADISINNISMERITASILSGSCYNTHFSNCYVKGNIVISTTRYVDIGLLVGDYYGSTLIDCYGIGNIEVSAGGSFFVGGLFGYEDSSSSVSNCYYIGNVNVTGATCNAVAGFTYRHSAVYFNSNISDSGSISLSLEQMKLQSSFVGWDFDTIWEFRAGSDYPVLQGFGNPIPPIPHEHSYTTNIVDPTCTEMGYTEHICSCGHSYVDSYVEPTGHDYQVTNRVEATCTEDGYVEYTCQNDGCSATKRQILPMLGHTFGDDNICDRCGYELPIHEHLYTTTTVDPTCTSMGYTEYTCSCGHSYRNNYVEPTRHDWDDGVVTMEATCTTEGLMTYTCQDCGATKTAVITAGHQWSEVVTVEKTCTTDGSKTKTCLVCGEEKIEIIPAGHNWNAGVETIAATCKTEGSKTCTCLDCGETQVFVIPALGHTYVNGVCTRCGEKFIDNVTPSSHPIYGMYFEIDDILSDYGPSLIDEYGVLLDYNSDAVLDKVAVYLTQDGTMWRRCIAVTGTNIRYATYVPYLSYQSDIKYTGLNHDWINTFSLRENAHGVWCYNDYVTIGVNLEDAYGRLLLSLYDIGQAGAETRIFDNLGEMIAWLENDHVHEPSGWIEDKPASCALGSKHKECTICHEILEREEISPVAEHVYDNACDAECNVCGAIRTPAHDLELLRDETGHWYECTNCEYVGEKEAHKGGTATCTEQAVCTECGAYYGTIPPHDLELMSDETHHWYACANCDYTEGVETHFGGEATCTEKAVCDVCNTEYGEPKVHTPSDWIVDVEPTAMHTGSRHKECTVCGAILETDIMPVLAKLVVANVEAKAGSIVSVTIDIQNNPGILGAVLTLNYDPALELLNAEAGSAWNTLYLTKPFTYSNPCKFAWDGVTGADYNNGTILVLTFKLPEDAEVGTVYNIDISYDFGNIIDGDMESVNVEIENGHIEVKPTKGDVNNDGIVDVADVIMLRRYLVGGYGVEIDTLAADINEDGHITIADVVLLRRMLVG